MRGDRPGVRGRCKRWWDAATTRGAKAALVLAVAATVGVSGCASGAGAGGAQAGAALNVKDFDAQTAPCSDLYGFVNGRWTRSTAIPPDESSYGTFDQLNDKSLQTQRSIAESAARNLTAPDTDPIAHKIGTLYQAAMDEKTVDAAGFDPIKPQLAAIDAIRTPSDIARFLREDAVRGGSLMFSLASGADFRDASRQIAFVSAGGLLLPSKDYYSDPRYAAVLDGYRSNLASALRLVGLSPAQATGQAGQALGLESQLAAASLSPVQQRDPANQYRPVTVAQADRLTPGFDWGAYLTAQHVSSRPNASRWPRQRSSGSSAICWHTRRSTGGRLICART